MWTPTPFSLSAEFCYVVSNIRLVPRGIEVSTAHPTLTTYFEGDYRLKAIFHGFSPFAKHVKKGQLSHPELGTTRDIFMTWKEQFFST